MKQPFSSPGLDTASPSGSAGSTDERCGSSTEAVVLGVDGCPGGWVGALLVGDTISVVARTTIAEVVSDAGAVAVVGIDMPIGLPDSGDQRAAESLARQRLPP